MLLSLALSCPNSPTGFPCPQHCLHNIGNSVALPDTGEQRGTVFPHERSVTAHNIKAGADMGSEVGLVSAWSCARHTLLMMNKSDCEIPGPPLRGTLSPPATSI